MNEDFSFAVEYAKSGRAFCKKCKENIAKDSLRVAIMIQSYIYDKKMPLWHHLSCFFQEKTHLKSVDEISNFSNLRWDDKEKIKKYLTDINISKKHSNGNSDISAVYTKLISSSKVCGETIKKGCTNVSKFSKGVKFTQFDPRPLWYNEDCFAEKKCEVNYKDSTNQKRKAENEGKPVNEIKKKALTREDRQLKVQSEMLLKMRDDLKNNLDENQMIKLLEYNCQHIIIGQQRLLEHLSDCMVFGALKECPECKSDRPYYLGSTYKCEGNLTEWTYCQYETRFPDREEFKIPPELKEDVVFLQNYKSKVQERRFPKCSDSEKIKKKLPLDDYKVFILGKFAVSDENIVKEIDELGGSISIDLDLSVDFCISTAAEVESKSDKIQQLEKLNIHVISYAFIEAIKKGSPVAYSMKQALLCQWGGDPIIKFGIKQEHGSKKKINEEESVKSVCHKVKVTAKGPAVDPETGLEASCHVFQVEKDFYNAVLVMVDMGKGTNSFYKLQMLESNRRSKSKYLVFRQWGRVGRPVDGKRIESFSNKKVAMNSFENIFLERTGNEWVNRHNFVKKPGLMYPIEIDYGKETEKVKELKPCDNSKLPKPIQELICLIFNIESMRTAMLEFEIDLTKMPLGKLSKKQIEQAYKVLGEAQQVLITGCNKNKILDVSNRFYSLIPHDFGLKASPLLDHEEIVKTKIEMLESLLEIEIAYSLLQSESSSFKSPVDENYEKLKTDIEILPKSSEEYKDIQTYMQNTNKNCRGLKLHEVFKINRHGENVRYQAYKHLHNKKLLWHGSRLTNFVGILSQGLRIAPPEAPPTGYMFGKGIYFADMVSKSANYCFINHSNPTGFILLCEVALGNMYPCTTAKNINKLPKDKHSTMGMGRTIPDPSKSIKRGDVEIPCGKPIQSGVQGSLNYNEYIVYDIKQVHIKYLLKVGINGKL